MKYQQSCVLVALTSMVLSLAACQGDDDSTTVVKPAAVASKPLPTADQPDAASPGKPTAPISITYEVMGNAIVGQPVLINLVISSPKGPVSVQYNILDGSALVFQSGQVERLEIADPSSGSAQQLSVIPQREGRLFVNVSVEIQAPVGLNIRSMAIPIKVGKAPEKATTNGELVEGPDGERVISLPAQAQ
jgi:hypothetical protein